MQIDFKALEQAFAPIAEIGQGEHTFDVGGTSVTLRILRPADEVEAQKYASPALENEGSVAAVEYMDRFRIAVLSHAIVAVGRQDFRGVDYVTTGEKLENGTEIKVPKHKALRDLLTRWTRPALSGVFNKYHELVLKTEKAAEAAIVFEPADIPSEIERLQQRVQELRTQADKAKALEGTKFSNTVAAVQSFQEEQTPPQPLPSRPPVEEAPVVQSVRQPISPQRAAPPPVMQVPTPAAPIPAQPVRAPVAPADSSFVDVDDNMGLHEALNAETLRIMEMRRGRSHPDEGGAINQARRRPPHFDAMDAEEEVGFLQAAAQQAQQVGTTSDGKPVFAMPAQDLNVRGGPRGRPQTDQLNPVVNHGGSTNPRFQRPKS